MRHLIRVLAVALPMAGAAAADGYYVLSGQYGDAAGDISFTETRGEDTIWVWPTEEGEVTFFIRNPQGAQGDWSAGTYNGYFTTDLPEEIDPPCSNGRITDAYGNTTGQWGSAQIRWTAEDQFVLRTWPCNGPMSLEMTANYAWGETQETGKLPVSVELRLQSDRIPLSREDLAYTRDGLDKNPAIYLDVTFSDGSREDYAYKKASADNILFDDVSGDPYDLIEINWWDVDPDRPELGKYAAQLTSTGKGTGHAILKVGFRNAPGVTAEVGAEVVSAQGGGRPVSVKLSLQSYVLPVSYGDRAYTLLNLDKNPAIYLEVTFEDGTVSEPFYQRDFADTVIFDDVSGDPLDLIEVVEWDVDRARPEKGTFAGQLTSTGKGTGEGFLKVSFRDQPEVTAMIPVVVVSVKD